MQGEQGVLAGCHHIPPQDQLLVGLILACTTATAAAGVTPVTAQRYCILCMTGLTTHDLVQPVALSRLH